MALSDDALSPRPSIPLLLPCAFALWLGCLFAGECSSYISTSVLIGLAVTLILLVVVWQLIWFKRGVKPHCAPALVLLFLLGILLVSFSFQSSAQERDGFAKQGTGVYSLRIVEDPVESSFGKRATALICSPNAGFLERAVGSVRVSLLLDGDDFSYGDEFQAKVSFKSVDESSLPYLNKNGFVLRCSVSDVSQLHSSKLGYLSGIRSDFANRVAQVLSFEGSDQDAAAVVEALVIGDRRALFDSQLYNDVKICGLAHLVAVSGAHLVIVMGLVAACVKAMRIPKVPALFLQLAFLFLYLIMVGFPISCIRAALMAGAGLLAYVSSRRSYALSSLAITIIVILAFDPSAAFSVSFGLSALSTLGIVLFTSKFCSWIAVPKGAVSSMVVQPFAMTCAALITTFPLSIASFSQFSIISPLSNIIAVPLITASCALGVLSFACMLVPFVSSLCMYGSYWFAWCFRSVVSALASVPHASIPVDLPFAVLLGASLLVCVALWFLWPKKFPRKSIAAICSMAVAFFLVSGVSVYGQTSFVMLDVGQGDAFLLRSQGKTLLIDTGNNPKKLLSALARNGVFRLDGLLVSHADDDHCGCLPDLRGVVPVRCVYLARGMDEVGTAKTKNLISEACEVAGNDGVQMLDVGSTLTFGALSCKVISPKQLVDKGENDDSICLLVSSDLNSDRVPEWRAFFGGDAESDVLQKLVDEGALGDVDVLKVSHHGSKASLNDDLLDAMRPEIALVSVGAKNRYGHPANNVMSMLQNRGVQVFRSDNQGDVVCNLGQEGIVVRAMK